MGPKRLYGRRPEAIQRDHRTIQKIRKDSGFELTDRIEVKVSANNGLKDSLAQFKDYICAEILADKLEILSEIPNGTDIDINDVLLKVIVSKKG